MNLAAMEQDPRFQALPEERKAILRQRATIPPPAGFNVSPSGAPQIPEQPPITWQSIIEGLTGKTTTEKAVTGATAAADVARFAGMMPSPMLRAAGALLPVAVGAVSEYAQGGSPWSGAATGALQSFLPNVAALTTSAALRQRKDVKELTNVVKEHLPVLAPHIERKVESWDQLFRGGKARKIAGDALSTVKNKIKGAIGVKGEVFPLMSSVTEAELEKQWSQRGPISSFTAANRQIAREAQANSTARPFEVWDEKITRLNQAADRFNMEKKPARAAELRERAWRMTEELTDKLRQVDPALADEYQLYRRQMYDTLNLERLLKKQGVITSGYPGNKIDMGRLQQLLNIPGFRSAFETSPMGRRFLEEAFRGAPPIGGDVPPRMRTRLYGHPSLQHALPMGGLSGHPEPGYHIGRRVPVPATPFEMLQNLLVNGMGQENQ